MKITISPEKNEEGEFDEIVHDRVTEVAITGIKINGSCWPMRFHRTHVGDDVNDLLGQVETLRQILLDKKNGGG